MDTELPWSDFDSGALSSGWRFPVSKRELRDALIRADARVASVSMQMPTWVGIVTHDGWLFHASVSGDTRVGYSGPEGSGWTRLTCFAVPVETLTERNREAHLEGLSVATRWLADLPSRGNAWLASDHELDVWLGPAGIRTDER